MRPEILSHDLKAALNMVAIAPGIGSPYRQSPIVGVRRFYLSRLMSHLYYTHDENEVVIRALWHARRGAGPDLARFEAGKP
jgi:plasmid stabilization system protein ParE